ncbi:hypothetical protein HNQ51_001271 [Inhella inkyongensis]|uniref:WbqC-like protein n=1 Tax=Inhella inkyongensis TaxID=392593 RepID=A0A840S3G4_9BURK|nr:WbqC family protein [Inhella inkyongensis]MBB5203978.1 hypothetical protein [Inhella inkyongensis]
MSATAALKVAVLQSNYIPWKGYFDLIASVDLFIFYDDVQYTHSDWRNRNRIKTAQGLQWLSVPVGASRQRLIHEVQIEDAHWQRKHWTSLQQAYGRAPHFERYRPFLEWVYCEQRWTHLSQLNQTLVRHIAQTELGLSTRFADSRDYPAEGRRLDRLLHLLVKAGATHYLSGPAARSYIEPERFEQAGIGLSWMDYSAYPEYPQLHGPFEHAVTVLDLLFHVGPEAALHLQRRSA